MKSPTKALWIGVTTKSGTDTWVQENTKNYLAVLREQQAVPVVIAPDVATTLPDGSTFVPDAEGRVAADLLDHLDGLILAGGGDVHPHFFGEELNGADVKRIDLRRDALELALSEAALTRDLPIFAICRGCQVLNVAAGGGMVQHFEGHRSPKGESAYHDVVVAPASQLRTIVGVDRLAVNTFHHQGLDQATLASSFVAVGYADPDCWLVEAFEAPAQRWAIGVQWHPERLFELTAPHRQLWESFLAACAETARANSVAVSAVSRKGAT